jgi:electron transfer flavoprotein beta subunit
MLGFVGHIEMDGNAIKVARIIEEGRQNVKAPLPVVLTIVQSIGEPRYPSFIGIRKAAKAAIPVWSIGELGTSAPAAFVTRTELITPPRHEVSCEVISGDSPASIAQTLVEKILAEKVL